MAPPPIRPALAVLARIAAYRRHGLHQEPEVVYQFPPDGAILDERPPAIQLCFRSAIDVRDIDKAGEFRFGGLASATPATGAGRPGQAHH